MFSNFSTGISVEESLVLFSKNGETHLELRQRQTPFFL
jgi:hypothetical protein